MSVDIKKLTVDTDDEREQWLQILEGAANYHWDLSGQFEPEIKTPKQDSKEEIVAKVHRGWARAIQEAAYLVSEWQVEEDDDIKRADG